MSTIHLSATLLPQWDRGIDDVAWKAGVASVTNAVAYANGSGHLTVDATFTSEGIHSTDFVQVRFAASGFPNGVIYSAWANVTRTGLNTYKVDGVTSPDSFLTVYCTLQADFVPNMTLEWEYRVNNGSDKGVSGASVNPFYVTRGTPTTLYHTVIHVGCDAAKRIEEADVQQQPGETPEQFQTRKEKPIFDAIWAEFEGDDICIQTVILFSV